MKEEIIAKTAKNLFSKYGYKRVSMDEISTTAGVTKKTVYTYFSSKEELLKYLINQEVKNMRKVIEKVENEEDDFFESVHKGIYNLLQYRKKSSFFKMLFGESEFFKDETLTNNLKVVEQSVKLYISEKLEYAVNKKFIVVQDIQIMTFLIYKMYIALFVEWNENVKELDEKKLVDTIMSVLKSGIERKEVEENV